MSIAAREKRSSSGIRFSGGQAVPRGKAACVVCAQKDYLEHRHKLSLFGAVPEGHIYEHCADPARDDEDVSESEANARPTKTLVKHRGVYYLRVFDLVRTTARVQRSASRAPRLAVAAALPSSARGSIRNGIGGHLRCSSACRRQASVRRGGRCR